MDAPFSPDINTVPYRDRASAGRWLAKELAAYADDDTVLVLGIPRGGVCVAAEVADALRAPLDVFLVRKVQVGGADKRNVGAVTSGGVCVLDQDVLQSVSTEAQDIAEAVSRVRDDVLQRERLYRENLPALRLAGRTLLLIDDGAASGRSLRAAVAALRPEMPAAILVATPVASPEAVAHLTKEADRLICPFVPQPFFSIGLAYERFPPLTDQDVCDRFTERKNRSYPTLTHDTGPYTDGARDV